MNFGKSDKTGISHQPGKKGITWILMCVKYYVTCMGKCLCDQYDVIVC